MIAENQHKQEENQHKREENLLNQEEILPQKGIHIGKTIRRLLEKQGVAPAELGQRIGRSERTVNAMMRKKHLHSKVMIQISQALNHDIIRYLYQPGQWPANKALKQQVQELQKENQALKKENGLLKEVNDLLKKQ